MIWPKQKVLSNHLSSFELFGHVFKDVINYYLPTQYRKRKLLLSIKHTGLHVSDLSVDLVYMYLNVT